MGACASKFKEFKGEVPPPAEKGEVAAAERDVKILEAKVKNDKTGMVKEVKLVEEKISKDEEVAAKDGEAKPRSLGHLLRENEAEKGSAKNGNATSPEPVAADAEAKGKAEKAPPATNDVKLSSPVEKNVGDIKPDSLNVGVEVSEKKTEEKSLAETEKKKTQEEPIEITKLEKPTETIKLEAKNVEVEKKIEEKSLAETEKKKTEEEPTEITKLETPIETIKLEAKDVEVEKKTEGNNLAEDTKIVTEASEKITEEKTEKKKTEEEPTEITKPETRAEITKPETLTEITKPETPTETIKLEVKNAEAEKKNGEKKLAEDTKIGTPAEVEENDKHIVEPTKIESSGKQRSTEVKTDEKKPVSDA